MLPICSCYPANGTIWEDFKNVEGIASLEEATPGGWALRLYRQVPLPVPSPFTKNAESKPASCSFPMLFFPAPIPSAPLKPLNCLKLPANVSFCPKVMCPGYCMTAVERK